MRPLVVKREGSDQTQADWTKLSRKHEIELDKDRRVVTVFGGKLTDCLNVGEEVAEAVEKLGVPLEEDTGTWYGEPAAATRARTAYCREKSITDWPCRPLRSVRVVEMRRPSPRGAAGNAPGGSLRLCETRLRVPGRSVRSSSTAARGCNEAGYSGPGTGWSGTCASGPQRPSVRKTIP